MRGDREIETLGGSLRVLAQQARATDSNPHDEGSSPSYPKRPADGFVFRNVFGFFICLKVDDPSQ